MPAGPAGQSAVTPAGDEGGRRKSVVVRRSQSPTTDSERDPQLPKHFSHFHAPPRYGPVLTSRSERRETL